MASHQRKLLLVLLLCFLPTQALGTDPAPPWAAPEKGSIVLSPQAGWSMGSQLDGPLVGMRLQFVFDYFIGGLQGQAVFVDAGVLYVTGLDLIGRYGPFFIGTGFNGHFLPGGTSHPTPGIPFAIGVYFPTPIDHLFAEISYRLNLILLRNSQEIYHTFLVGLSFETGS